MTTWNYRVMTRALPDGVHTYAIHEVYYDDLGLVETWTEAPDGPMGDTLAELRSDHRMMAEAFELPVLDYETGKEVEE